MFNIEYMRSRGGYLQGNRENDDNGKNPRTFFIFKSISKRDLTSLNKVIHNQILKIVFVNRE